MRANPAALSHGLYKAYLDFSAAVRKSLGDSLYDLVNIRASQINGCAFCLDMHSKEAKIHGERELRLYHLPVWRESPLFDARERAALAWTESVTRLGEYGVPDAVYDEVRAQFDEKQLADLTFAVMAINGWNRMSIAFRNQPGTMDAVLGLDKAGLS